MTGQRFANDPAYRQWLIDSRASQGVPLTIQDPLVLADAARCFAPYLPKLTTGRRSRARRSAA